MKKYILLVLMLCYPRLAFAAIPTTSVPVTSSSSTTTTVTCSWDEDCDDNNPCTYDDCDPYPYCTWFPSYLGPCDDGLYCNGSDTCGEDDGLCSLHEGNPCPEGTVCNEDTDSCDANSGSSTTTTSTQISSTTTTLPAGESFAISGYVMGATVEDVTVLLAGATSRARTTDKHGYYEFLDLASGYYTLKPEKDGYSFQPPNHVIQNLTSDLVEINFEATKTRCLAQSIYGENSQEVDVLGEFRDKVLSKSPEGQKLIKLYYQWSPIIVRAMEANEDLKQDIKGMIDELLSLVERTLK